jgi:hypothetical protein
LKVFVRSDEKIAVQSISPRKGHGDLSTLPSKENPHRDRSRYLFLEVSKILERSIGVEPTAG